MKEKIIITGGANGIGRVTAYHLARRGYTVAIMDNDIQALEEIIAKEKALQLEGYCCDLTDESQIKTTVDKMTQDNASIIALINNAGIAINKPIQTLTLDEWNKVIASNLTSLFLMTKALENELIQSKGCVVNIASTRAFMSEPHTEAYSASKGGIVALTHALAVSLGPAIRVNCISPGWIDVTPYNKHTKSTKLSERDHLQHPVGRVGTPQDVAEMICFLIEEAGFVTGQNFVIDGGMTKKMIYE